jgi:flagellum-specific peptidoglycan hydrolase FlgJ
MFKLSDTKSKMPRFSLALLCLCFITHLKAQPPLFQNFEYIETYSVEAVQQMVEHHIPASVIIAQAILESRSGTSDLARRSNNHFGIKCHIEWGGDTIVKHDDTLSECFRRYDTSIDSYTDHSLFLKSRARYAALFELPVSDYAAWCYGLKSAGYATCPNYAELLITIIENFKLYELDRPTYLSPKNLMNFGSETLRSTPVQKTEQSLQVLVKK